VINTSKTRLALIALMTTSVLCACAQDGADDTTTRDAGDAASASATPVVTSTETMSDIEPRASDDATPATSNDETASDDGASESLANLAGPPPFRFTLSSEGLPEDGMWKCHPIFGDFNEDGHVDLAAIPRLGKGVRAWAGDGTGRWTESSDGLVLAENSCGGGISFADVNNDGKLDLCVADHCQGTYVYFGNGTGRWLKVAGPMIAQVSPKPDLQEIYSGTEDLATGDIDSDGDIDMIVGASDKGGMAIWLNDGNGRTWTRSASNGGLPAEGWVPRLMLVDLNGDEHLDLVANRSVGPRAYIGDGTGFFIERSLGLPEPTVYGIYIGLDVADMNNDGRNDIVVANWVDGPEIYYQTEEGRWSKAEDVFPDLTGGSVGVAAIDLDLDGHRDIVCTGRFSRAPGPSRGVFALHADGNGRYRFIENSGLPKTGLLGMTGVRAEDVNGDGVPDVVACSGLIVESVPGGATTPVVPNRLLAWITHVPETSSSGSPRSTETDQ